MNDNPLSYRLCVAVMLLANFLLWRVMFLLGQYVASFYPSN